MTDQEKLDALNAEMAILEPSRKRYYEAATEAQKLGEKIRQKNLTSARYKLELQTSFVECEYPAMGVAEKEGSATFTSLEQAELLIKALRSQSSYYYAYVLHWQGPGEYRVVPDYRSDHDNETVYTANFIKA